MYKHYKLALTAVAFLAISNIAIAAPVVVGSVNPDTKQITIFKDLLVNKFLDGTPILNFYGSFDETSKEYIMVRAGKAPDGTCQTDAFRLVRIPGNRLAIARDNLTHAPWHGNGSIYTLKTCFSTTCSGSCQVLGVPETPDLTDYECFCSSGSGQCEATFDVLHKHDDIVWQGPEGPAG